MNALVRSEIRKLTTTRLFLGLLGGGAALVTLYVTVIAFTAGSASGGRDAIPALSDPASVRMVYGVPFEIGYLMPLVLGVMLICSEFRHGTITPTFLAAPRRERVVAAKLVAAGVAGFVMGLVLTAYATALGAIEIAARGYPVRLTTDGIPRLLVLMVVGLAVWCIFGVGFGALLHNQVAAIVTAIALVTIVESVLTLLMRWIHLGAVAAYLPSNASTAIVEPANVAGNELLSWWGGALVLLAWGLATAAAGSWLTVRRDVTR